MFMLLTFILVICFVIMALFAMIEEVNNDVYNSITLTIGVIALISVIFLCIDLQNPTAMDVYRGKTTLEITYADGIPVDSIVIFKKR